MTKENTTTSNNESTFTLPYKVICNRCKSEKMVRHDVLLKRLMKHKGTLQERFIAETKTYLCQNCKRIEKNKELEKLFNK